MMKLDKSAFGIGTVIVGMVVAAAAVAQMAAYSTARAPAGKIVSQAVDVPPTRVGVNLYILADWNPERVFVNLVGTTNWQMSGPAVPSGWPVMDPADLDAHGWVKSLPKGVYGELMLLKPAQTPASIRCTFAGQGVLDVGGAKLSSRRPQVIEFVFNGKSAWLHLSETNPADPIRDIDCRESDQPKGLTFAPQFLESLKGFHIVRFMDWQKVNANEGSNWARRALPNSSSQVGPEGAAVEYMVDLANQADVTPWFALPYNADDAYIEGFARYVHDHLSPGRQVYVELGNEIWNAAFPAAKQARQEGLNAGLSKDEMEAGLLRYAEKSKYALAIWTRVFADNPKRLVRVVSVQTWMRTAEIVLGYKPLLPFVDAVATAPYFSADLFTPPQDLDTIFKRIDAGVDDAIEKAAQTKAIANHLGKRYIAYEGGQHLRVNPPLADLMTSVQRDPRMGAAYARYLDEWKRRIGDDIVLYALTSPIGAGGSWGLREYSGQPLSDAPKLQATRAFMADQAHVEHRADNHADSVQR